MKIVLIMFSSIFLIGCAMLDPGFYKTLSDDLTLDGNERGCVPTADEDDGVYILGFDCQW